MIGDDEPSRNIFKRVVDARLAKLASAKSLPRQRYGVDRHGSHALVTGDASRVTGKPVQNAFVDSLDGRLRDELLNETPFVPLAHTRQATRNDLMVASVVRHLRFTLSSGHSARNGRGPCATPMCDQRFTYPMTLRARFTSC
jgi:hypothetical protein